MSKRLNEFASIKDLMKDVIQENNLSKGMLKIKVEDTWTEIMGKGVASYTNSVALNGKTLIVRLSSSTLREELSYGKDKIIKMMNEGLGKDLISKIKLA